MQEENEQTKKGKIMKTIKCHQVEVPLYLELFTRIEYSTATVVVGFSVPFVWLWQVIWWAFPKWLYDYQSGDCVNYIPDYKAIGSDKEATGDKVRPFFGFVIRNAEGELYDWMWWKHIEKY